MSHQDWTPVVWKKNPPKGSTTKAKQAGEPVSVEKKFLAGQNKSGKKHPPNAVKIEQETENFRVERVGYSFRTALQKARLAKGLTQAQLAMNISESEALIKDYESGKGIPNVQVVQKINRALGVQLPSFKN
ncbi:putative transcription factor [Babesia microti strain RI]|uniref:Transcription factor n=1 Tax=Babesia microti (strain RI) TaxID=1133968 RepID=I7I7P7_BABMR|nr:putative transcription factor [Babesia microti strain RI]CCF72498.1 putative transcription factor [Babesia microti strain RI]|eukprot:XP_012647107.1 putative transcription factor [Babesia microti strain RI]